LGSGRYWGGSIRNHRWRDIQLHFRHKKKGHMKYVEKRKQLRAFFNRPECPSPASVFDPLSARIAEMTGFKVGLFSGKIASATTLAAPDLNLITLTEFADQVRRIMRASDLSLIVDADHGYGNALNTMRTIQELEHAGVSMISIEDTVLPARFGQPLGQAELITLQEMVGKLKAAVAARRDPELMIAARTAALKHEGIQRTVERARAYAATGVDAIFLLHVTSLDDIGAIHTASGLPVIVGLGPPSLRREDMAARGARLLTQGHHPVAVMIRALQGAYAHLHKGGTPAEMLSTLATEEDVENIISSELHRKWQREYLQAN
jgi:oxaloacetate decarboxylase